jgi:subtilisin family serine protease
MIHGPFSLVGVQDARVDIQAWINTEANFDFFGIYASVDGSNFSGAYWWGDWASASGGSGWMNISFDLKRVYTLGDLRGEPDVWIALVFSSDSSITYEGAYVDDVVLEKITGGYDDLTSDVYDHQQWSLENNQQLWGIDDADIDAAAAWGVTHGSNATTVAVIDEGVDLTHPDLAGKLVTGYDATGGGSGGGAVGDEAHGTNCAGIAAATTANGVGVAGIAREAKIMPVRIFAGGVTTDAWAADGLNWAWMNGADVLSNSWGGGSPVTAITDAISAAKASGRGGKGSVVFFSSGNDNGPVSYPAILSTVQAIGALSPCDQRKAPTSCDGEYWWGSNYGSELDLTAPGVHMYSTDIQGAAGYDTGDYFYDFNGTSSATPVAAGVAALMLGYNPSATATQVETALAASADDLGAPGWDSETGYGRINAYEALQAMAPEEFDWGDAPDPTYPTLAASNGARHLLGGPLMLGSIVDPDLDGQPTANADGDDLDGSDDEDGVTLAPRLEKWTLSPVTIVATAPGVLNAWVDFNIDGDWLDAGEQIFVDLPLVPGPNALDFPVPGSATTGTSFARFRFSSLGGLQPTGLAPDGEVEDYQVSVGPPMDLVLESTTINSTVTYEACNSITAGPACDLQSSAVVTLRAGSRVVFVNGLSVSNGARLTVDIATPAGCP